MTAQQERDYAESVALGLPGVGAVFAADPPQPQAVDPREHLISELRQLLGSKFGRFFAFKALKAADWDVETAYRNVQRGE